MLGVLNNKNLMSFRSLRRTMIKKDYFQYRLQSIKTSLQQTAEIARTIKQDRPYYPFFIPFSFPTGPQKLSYHHFLLHLLKSINSYSLECLIKRLNHIFPSNLKIYGLSISKVHPNTLSLKTNVSDNLVYTCSRNKQIGKKLYEVTFEFF